MDDLGFLKIEDGLSEQPNAAPFLNAFRKHFKWDPETTHMHLYRDTQRTYVFNWRSVSSLF